MSFDILQDKIKEKKNPTVAGLDARVEYIPPHILKKYTSQYGETLQAAALAVEELAAASSTRCAMWCLQSSPSRPILRCWAGGGWRRWRRLSPTLRARACMSSPTSSGEPRNRRYRLRRGLVGHHSGGRNGLRGL